MKRLTIEDVQPLNERLRSLGAETIIGFPETTDNGILKLKAFHDIGDTALFHLTDSARATIDPDLQQRFPLRVGGWPVGIKTRATKDWHKLRVDLPRENIYVGGRHEFGDPIIAESKKEKFVTEFNTLMHTATAEGWLLSFSWNIDSEPAGDFGTDPPSPEISRILMPQESGTVGLRESLIGVASLNYGDGVVEAVHSAVVNLGLLA
jgi:hypothetical protein